MIIIKLNEVVVELTDLLLEKLKIYIQGIGGNESGGILVGGFIPTENKYVITDASVPCSKDESGPTYFIRNRENAQKIIDKIWIDSKGTINYLGEWHTHGCEMPMPSNTDKRLLQMILRDRSNVWNEVFMLIVGRNNTFYLGMTNNKSKGKTVAAVSLGRDKHAYIFD